MFAFFRKKRAISGNTRQFRRFKSFGLIKYTLLKGTLHKDVVINPKDISAGGTLFISDADLPQGRILEMDIYLPPLKDFFTVIGRIISSAKIKNAKKYLIRVCFMTMDQQEKKIINSYVENIARQSFAHRFMDKPCGTYKRKEPAFSFKEG